MFKRLREWWIYWRYRNITRRWQLLRPRLMRLRRQPQMPGSPMRPRARGTAMYAPTRSSNARGLLFLTVSAAVLAVVNTLLGPSLVLDVILFAGMAYAYIQYARV